jgi:hypothetical protein
VWQIALVLRILSTVVLGHPVLVAWKAWARAASRLLAALAVGTGVYGLVLLVMVELCPSDRPLAGLLYGAGLAAAACFGICAGALAARNDQWRIVAHGMAGLALLLPVELVVHASISGGQRPMYAIYLLGSAIGGLVAVRMLSAMPLPTGSPVAVVAIAARHADRRTG